MYSTVLSEYRVSTDSHVCITWVSNEIPVTVSVQSKIGNVAE